MSAKTCFEFRLYGSDPGGGGGGGGLLPKKLDRGVRRASQNLYPIYDQNLLFFLPYL